MVTKSKAVIKQEIEDFKNTNKGYYSDYYIGITNNVETRKKQHIGKGWYTKGKPFKFWKCENNDIAVKIEQYFQNKGMEKENKRSKGVEESVYVYCFKMTGKNKNRILMERIIEKIVRKLLNEIKSSRDEKMIKIIKDEYEKIKPTS